MKSNKVLQNLICFFIITFSVIDIFVKSLCFEEDLILLIIFLVLDIVFLLGALVCLVSNNNRKGKLLILIVINVVLILYNFFIDIYIIIWVSKVQLGSASIIESITNIFNLPLLFILILSIFSYIETQDEQPKNQMEA